MTFETSKHGYWINIVGDVFPMKKLQQHKQWMIEHHMYQESNNPEESAVEDGWIGISFSPEGKSVAIRHRSSSLERLAIKGLRAVIDIHDLKKTTVYTQFEKGEGQKIIRNLSDKSMDSDRHKTRAEEVAYLRGRMNVQRKENSRLRAENDMLVSTKSSKWKNVWEELNKLVSLGKSMKRNQQISINILYQYTKEQRTELGLLDYYFGHELQRSIDMIDYYIDNLREMLVGLEKTKTD